MNTDLVTDIQNYQERFLKSKHAWFSLQSAITMFNFERHTPCIYKDLQGNNVVVTAVSKDEKHDQYAWSDKVYLGRVVEFVGHVDYETFLKDYYYSLGGLLPNEGI